MNTVLHLSSSSGPGGAERVVCALASSLDPARFRSIVALFRPGWLKEECEARGLATYVLPHEGWLDWRWMVECAHLVKRERVSVVHAHEFDAIVHGWVVAKYTGIPMVATVHGKNYFWEKARRRWAYRLVSRDAMVVAVSEDLKRFIVEKTGIAAGSVRVIYNGVDETIEAQMSDARQFKRDIGIAEADLVVGVVGNLYPVKGHRYLLEALPQVLNVVPNTTVLLIGRGELEVELKAQAKALGVDDKVRFLGLRDDIPKLLAVMDVFAMPSLSEGLSIALLEAMAAGKPVVATNVGGNPELVQEGETGYLVPAEHPDALAQALIRLLSDPDVRVKFGGAGKLRVAERFTLPTMAGQYQRNYERLLAGIHG